jgi:hypothetical protein
MRTIGGEASAAGDLATTWKMMVTPFDAVIGETNRYYDEIAAAAEAPYPQARETFARIEERMGREGHPFVRMLAPALSRASHLARLNDASRRGTLAAARVRAYEQQHGMLPESLDEIGPGAIDPFTGQPFGYQRTDSGFRIYSLGANGTDDGGEHGLRGDTLDYVVFPPQPR